MADILKPLIAVYQERPRLCFVHCRYDDLIAVESDISHQLACGFLNRTVNPYYQYVISHDQFLYREQPWNRGQIGPGLILIGNLSDIRVARRQIELRLQYNHADAENSVEGWLSHLVNNNLRQDFLKRPMAVVSFGDLLGGMPYLAKIFGRDGRVFTKTLRKQRTGFALLSSTAEDGSFGYWDWRKVLPHTEPCMISEPLEIKPKREFRCLISDGQVSSVTRPRAVRYEPPDAAAREFAEEFVAAISGLSFPRTFGLEIGETADRGWAVIELCPISETRFYVGDRIDWLIADVYGVDCRMADHEYEEFTQSIIASCERPLAGNAVK